jgi:uncharacterized protein (TIGR02217 family)
MPPTVLNLVLPDWISRDSVFYYEFYTDVFEEALSGASQRNAMWTDWRLVGDLTTAIAKQATLEQIINLFMACKGRAYGFLLQHPMDYSVASQTLGTGTGALDDFQLIKTYTYGAGSHDHTIYQPVGGSLTVYYDGVEQVSGWTLLDNGILRANPGVGVVVSADFQFYFPMRFDTDKLATQWEAYAAGTATLPVVEVR